MRRSAAMAAFALLASACAGPRAPDRDAFIRTRMAALVLPRSIDDVWPLARELLSEQGYNGTDEPGLFQYESEWREEVAPSRLAGKLTRYRAQGIRLPEARCRVVFTRYVRDQERGRAPTDESEGTRDFEMELSLYKKVDPDAAALLEREATSPSERR